MSPDIVSSSGSSYTLYFILVFPVISHVIQYEYSQLSRRSRRHRHRRHPEHFGSQREQERTGEREKRSWRKRKQMLKIDGREIRTWRKFSLTSHTIPYQYLCMFPFSLHRSALTLSISMFPFACTEYKHPWIYTCNVYTSL